MPGYKYKFAFGPTSNEFTPNINISDEAYEGTLDEFVAAVISAMSNFLSRFSINK